MTDHDLAAFRSCLGQLRTALDRFEDILLRSITITPPVSTGLIKASPGYAPGPLFHCAEGHAKVVSLSEDCPVCAIKRLTGYSDKWCDRCEDITPHVGARHIHACCVECLELDPGCVDTLRKKDTRIQGLTLVPERDSPR